MAHVFTASFASFACLSLISLRVHWLYLATSAAATLRSQNVDRIYDRRLETGTKDAQRGHICRSTSIFLISAMALAGLRPLGQARAQLRMAWQPEDRRGA